VEKEETKKETRESIFQRYEAKKKTISDDIQVKYPKLSGYISYF
jgi:hypothetical protein